MKKNSALVVAGVIFTLVALAHLARYFHKTEIIVSGHVLSLEVSLVAFVVSGLLAIWMFMAKASKN